jgi:hypothetical protein
MNSFDHERMNKLIDLITVMPPDNATHQRGHKYDSYHISSSLFRFPFIASEIFNCEINSILDKFFDAPEQKLKDN